jgi:hypothetical protein
MDIVGEASSVRWEVLWMSHFCPFLWGDEFDVVTGYGGGWASLAYTFFESIKGATTAAQGARTTTIQLIL